MVWFGNLLAAVAIVSRLFVACRDIATRTIPNSIVAVVAVAGLTGRLLMDLPAFAISAAAVLLVFLLVLHAHGAFVGGDVKLIPAIALRLPLPSIRNFVFVPIMSGGILALLHLLARWILRGRPPLAPPPRGTFLLRRVFCAERWRIAHHGSLSYGVAIACGGNWVIPSRLGS
jgi:prepilin peptidase CpaA